jgi:hypothetical protein
MIISKPTPHGAGITIYGDYNDLQGLHETIHEICKESGPLEGKINEFVLGLAYDIRHAYQGDRERLVVNDDEGEGAEYFGESVLWPYFLVQVSLLRWATAFMPTTKTIQANLYRLEACTEEALLSYDRSIGAECMKLMNSFADLSHDYLTAFISERAEAYVRYPSSGKKRFKQLPAILRSLEPLSPEYMKYRLEMQTAAKKLGCKPEDLTTTSEEWPEFKW